MECLKSATITQEPPQAAPARGTCGSTHTPNARLGLIRRELKMAGRDAVELMRGQRESSCIWNTAPVYLLYPFQTSGLPIIYWTRVWELFGNAANCYRTGTCILLCKTLRGLDSCYNLEQMGENCYEIIIFQYVCENHEEVNMLRINFVKQHAINIADNILLEIYVLHIFEDLVNFLFWLFCV